MQLKVYRSKSVPGALRRVRRDLGDSALILSTKRIRKKRLLGLLPSLEYEITAAVDENGSGSARNHEGRGIPQSRAGGVGRSRSPGGNRALRDGSELAQLKEELAALRKVLSRNVVSTSPERGPFHSESKRVHYDRLVGAGLDRALACSLLHETDESDGPFDARRKIHQSLAQMVAVEPISVQPDRPLRALLLGPTGVGKTTTIAKLAALLSLAEEQSVALINLDTYRIGAARQLAIYAEIIGVPVETVDRLENLAKALERHQGKDCILIDTAGHSHANLSALGELPAFLARRNDVEAHLVLSANTKNRDLEEMIDAFEVFQARRLIFTKLDETSTPGTIANHLVRTGKKLSCLTDGQKVTENLLLPNCEMVADLAIPLN